MALDGRWYLSNRYVCHSNQVWPYQAVDAASPTTPSISLIQAYRDGVLVHLPTNMLVEGTDGEQQSDVQC